MVEFNYGAINQILEWDQIHNYEFDNGLKALETISNIAGYTKEPFIQGSAFENLIRDNPSIVEHIFNYLEEHFQDKLTEYIIENNIEMEQDGEECEDCEDITV